MLHLEQPEVAFPQPFPLPVTHWAVLLFPSHEGHYHICLRGRSMPHFTARLLPLPEGLSWTWAAFAQTEGGK